MYIYLPYYPFIFYLKIKKSQEYDGNDFYYLALKLMFQLRPFGKLFDVLYRQMVTTVFRLLGVTMRLFNQFL